MTIAEELQRRIQQLVAENRKIEAIKLLVDTTHCGLKDAKAYVDNLGPAYFNSSKKPVTNQHIDEQLINLLTKGNKLAAIKLYKDFSGAGLAESKDYVESLKSGAFSAKEITPTRRNETRSKKNRDTQIDDILSDQGAKSKSGCFVATVCYGNYNAPEVLTLRQFRDEYLIHSYFGKWFVGFYYAVSPFIAKQIDKSVTLKRILRIYILNPIVRKLSQTLNQ